MSSVVILHKLNRMSLYLNLCEKKLETSCGAASFNYFTLQLRICTRKTDKSMNLFEGKQLNKSFLTFRRIYVFRLKICTCSNFKGTQGWEFLWSRFWISLLIVIPHSKMDVFYKNFCWFNQNCGGWGCFRVYSECAEAKDFLKIEQKKCSQMIVLESLYTYSARFFGKWH